jgi:riboflavin synthase alpha subunit
MFTGLIQHLGCIKDLPPLQAAPGASGEARGISLVVEASGMDLPAMGDSVAVNGCCLTVSAAPVEGVGSVRLDFDVVPRTLELTTLGGLQLGDEVNLEPALRVGDHLGGHMVQGHVDGVGVIDSVTRDGDDVRVWCRLPGELAALVVERGSITIDGVSLTVTEAHQDRFCVALIPVTLQETTLGRLEPGSSVNIECDMLARLVAKMLESRQSS